MITKIKNHIVFRFIKEYIFQHYKVILLAILLMIGEAVASSSTAYLAQPIMDKVFINKDITTLKFLTVIVLLSFGLKTFCAYWKYVLLAVVESRIVISLQRMLFKKVIRSDMQYFDRSSIGAILNHFVTDVQNIKQALSTIILNFGRDLFTIIMLISIMFWQNYKMAIFCFVGLPILFVPLSKIAQKLKRFAMLTKVENDTLTSHLNDCLTGIRVIKAYGGENIEIQTFDKITESIAKLSVKAIKKAAMSSPMMEMFAATAVAVTLLYGGDQVISGNMTTGSFFSFLTALVMLTRPARSLGNTGFLLQNAIVALNKVYHVADSQNHIEYNNIDQTTPLLANAHISFKNVSFTYSGIDGQSIIKNLNLDIKNGAQVALVGSSGGGKSTVVNLLLRFYDVTEGAVTINNHNVKSIEINHLRSNITYVGQECFIFEDTVKNNIIYGLKNVTDDQIKNAISESGADFIYKLPFGLETQVKQQGCLSGGQKQLISIVRAMLKNSPILILDEATSSLDNNSEREVKQALDKLIKGKTTIIIAHRLSTIINCDQIHVINGGQIVESGTHEELLFKKGFYEQLHSAQNN